MNDIKLKRRCDNTWDIEGTHNLFKVEKRIESKKPIFICFYEEIHIDELRPKWSRNTGLKTTKLHDKKEAFEFVLNKFKIFLENKKILDKNVKQEYEEVFKCTGGKIFPVTTHKNIS